MTKQQQNIQDILPRRTQKIQGEVLKKVTIQYKQIWHQTSGKSNKRNHNSLIWPHINSEDDLVEKKDDLKWRKKMSMVKNIL